MRWLNRLKWTGTALLAVLLATFALSSFWCFVARGRAAAVHIHNGQVHLEWSDSPGIQRYWQSVYGRGIGYYRIHTNLDWSLPQVLHTGYVDLPLPAFWIATCPLWLVILIVAVPTLLLWMLCCAFQRWRRTANCCRKCGYDLTGNVSGVCPECGRAVPTRNPKREPCKGD
jgi:hypothetical protein